MKAVILGLLFLFLACKSSNCIWNSDYDIVLEKPNSDKLIGNYVLSVASQKFLQSNFAEWPM